LQVRFISAAAAPKHTLEQSSLNNQGILMAIIKPICLSALMLVAANAVATQGDSFIHLTPLNSQQFAVHRHDGPDAVVSATGELSIAGKNLPVNQAQKDLVIHYFAAAWALRNDSFATGIAGASTAITAISSVITGLANGEPDKIGQDVEAKAAQVEAQAQKVCSDLHELVAVQNGLAESLPEFKPYALIDAKSVDECRAD
jgi:hypothetical protein